jgi:hypothetical protein
VLIETCASQKRDAAIMPLDLDPIQLNRIKVEIFRLSMIFSDFSSPAEAGFAKAGNRVSLFGIML